jgi:protein-S-isoprenylcysteine O-methyltransferase Ste14
LRFSLRSFIVAPERLSIWKGNTMSNVQLARGDIQRKIYARFLAAFPVLFVIFFLPAGTLAYWEAWVYSAILLIPVLFVVAYLLKHDPELLERRMRMREKEAAQKRIINLSYPYYLLTFLLPGLDRRFEWSVVPVELVIAADILVLLGYGIVFLVYRENSYASRIIEVEREQKVISSGPYAVVRHPMYLGVLLMYTLSPLALGSYWALIPGLLIIPILVARIRNEEEVLARELDGYSEYKQKIRYRLIPGIW